MQVVNRWDLKGGCKGEHCKRCSEKCLYVVLKKPKWVVEQKYVRVKYLHAIFYSAVKLTSQQCMEEHVLRAVINV